MNMYDTKSISCSKCGQFLGEVDFEAKIIHPLCGKCANPLPEGDKILYTINNYQNKNRNIVTNSLTKL